MPPTSTTIVAWQVDGDRNGGEVAPSGGLGDPLVGDDVMSGSIDYVQNMTRKI